RMNFLPVPTRAFSDPGHLLAEWEKYQDLAMKRMMSGLALGAGKCPAFHCVAGFEAPELRRFGKLFRREVPKHEKQLFTFLREDKDANHRAYAAFLLAHVRGGKKLVRELALNLRDSAETVRNNVLRVFGYIAKYHPELSLPVEAIAETLRFPTATDRNKALF